MAQAIIPQKPSIKTVSKASILMTVMLMLPATTVLAANAPVYQVTQPNGELRITDNLDDAYQLAGSKTQNIKLLDNLPTPVTPATLSKNATQSLPIKPIAIPETNTVALNPNITAENVPNPAMPVAPVAPMPTSQAAELRPESLTANPTKISKKGDYRLEIVSPLNEMLYHRPAQNITIEVSVKPKLKQGDSVSYWIDGKKIAQTQDLTLEISSLEIPLDKHTLEVEVTNILNQPIATAQADFYVAQNTIAIQKRRKLEQLKAQLEAYDDLPWYQKLAVRLGIQKK